MTSRFQTLIIGLDFSKVSKQAFQAALVLQKKFSSKLVLAHIPLLPQGLLDRTPEPVRRKFLSNLESEIRRYYKVRNTQSFEIVTSFGQPHEELNRIAQNYPDPLIVIGGSGLSLLTRFTLGSTAEKLVVYSKTPVFVFRGSRFQWPKKLLIPCDLSEKSKEIVQCASIFSKENKIPGEVLFVSEPLLPSLDYENWTSLHQQAEASRKEEFKKLSQSTPYLKFKIVKGRAAEEIVKASKKAGLIIIAPHNKHQFFPTFGSVSAKVVRSSPHSVLVIP